MLEMQPIRFKCDVYESTPIYFALNKEETEFLYDANRKLVCVYGISAAVQFCNKYRSETKIYIEIAWGQLNEYLWRDRENRRMQFGAYKKLPAFVLQELSQHSSIYIRHCLHLSEDGKSIAYTPDTKHGALDRQIRTTFERYLTKYYSEFMSAHQIRDFAAAMAKGDYQVEIGDTREDFSFAFSGQDLKSPSSQFRSCMSYEKNDPHYSPNLPCHPAEMYAAGDLRISFIRNPIDRKKILARSILYPAKMTFSKVYAVSAEMETILSNLLKEKGYRYRASLVGARLLREEYKPGMCVMPYVDGPQYLIETGCGEFFEISDDSDGHVGIANDTYGTAYIHDPEPEHTYFCENCEEDQNDEDSVEVVTSRRRSYNNHSTWCSHCADNAATYCEITEERYSDHQFNFSEGYIMRGSRRINVTYCVEAVGDEFFYCENSDTSFRCDDFASIEVETGSSTQIWCEEENEGDFFFCENTDTYYSTADFTPIEVCGRQADSEKWCKEENEGEFFFCQNTQTKYCATTYEEISVRRFGLPTEQWCKEKNEGDFFWCEYTNEYLSIEFLNPQKTAEIYLLHMSLI